MLIFYLESDFSPIEIKTSEHEDFVDYEVEFAELNDEHHARKNMILEYLFCLLFLSKTFSQIFTRFRIVSICQRTYIIFRSDILYYLGRSIPTTGETSLFCFSMYRTLYCAVSLWMKHKLPQYHCTLANCWKSLRLSI